MANSEAFSIKPKSIEKAMLSPTDKTIFSSKPSLFNFRIERRRKPGIKVKKIKPTTSLKTEISSRTAILVRAIMIIARPNHLIGDKVTPCSAIFYSSQASQDTPVSVYCCLVGIFPLNEFPGIPCDFIEVGMIQSPDNILGNAFW